MEVASLTTRPGSLPARFTGRSPLLRLQSDDRLVALTRSGHHGAFEVLVSRYQARLLAFCRHMLGSKEDAEDVLQEVFTAAFNALHADERTVMVRPWLYRIARNRSLNHMRKTQAIGVDSMDIHLSEHGLSTADHAHKREDFRLLVEDVGELAETQRTALLLREMENLSYDQIADAMETTVPAVKSLLVRARVSLAEAAEARAMPCDEVRLALGEAAEGIAKVSPAARRHLRDCERCTAFRTHLKDTNKALAAVFPIGGVFLIKKLVLAHLGKAAGAGGGAAASGGAAAGGGALSGLLPAAIGAGATKAAAGLAVTALFTAGAVEVHHAKDAPRHRVVKAHATPAVHPAPTIAAHLDRALVPPAHSARLAHHAAVVERVAKRRNAAKVIRASLTTPPVKTTAALRPAVVKKAVTPAPAPTPVPARTPTPAPTTPVTQTITDTTTLPSTVAPTSPTPAPTTTTPPATTPPPATTSPPPSDPPPATTPPPTTTTPPPVVTVPPAVPPVTPGP